MVGCEDFIGGDLNEDPNNPISVPYTAQMPSIQINLADVYGGAFSRFNCMLVQQVEGVARQWSSFNQYTGLTPNRFDAAWQNIYENVLNEIGVARTSATVVGANHVVGVLNIMEAFALMAATDQWDSMPYGEALQGEANFNPAYDNQAAIYTAVLALLDSGVTLLQGAAGTVALGGEDSFYGGNTDRWIAAARGIRARGLVKQGDFTKAMDEAMNSFADATGNLAYQYPDLNAAGQWYRFNRDREGDIEFHPTMAGIMMETNDTNRMNVMSPVFKISHPYMVPNFLQEMVTFREMQFIIAEADFRLNGGTQTGYDAYLAGIQASFTRLGLGDDLYQEYLTQAGVDPGVGNLTLEQIMTQKYVAMYLQPETYSDWRRTDIPSLVPVSGTIVPVRWDYPSTEYLFNINAPDETETSIFNDNVGWDN